MRESSPARAAPPADAAPGRSADTGRAAGGAPHGGSSKATIAVTFDRTFSATGVRYTTIRQQPRMLASRLTKLATAKGSLSAELRAGCRAAATLTAGEAAPVRGAERGAAAATMGAGAEPRAVTQPLTPKPQ